jgi:lipopolysaccharide export system protein LptA
MIRTRFIPPVLSLLPLALLGMSADAQVMKGHDSNAPVDFTADRIEVQDRADRVVVQGNVIVKQAGLTMTAQRLTVAYHQSGGVEIDRMDASGNVVVTRTNERASGNVAIYDLNRRLITMVGNVQLTQGTNKLTGQRLLIDLASGRSTVDSKASGAPGTSTSPNGRVSGTFTVRKTDN